MDIALLVQSISSTFQEGTGWFDELFRMQDATGSSCFGRTPGAFARTVGRLHGRLYHHLRMEDRRSSGSCIGIGVS